MIFLYVGRQFSYRYFAHVHILQAEAWTLSCSKLPFQKCLRGGHPSVVQLVSPSRAKERFVYCSVYKQRSCLPPEQRAGVFTAPYKRFGASCAQGSFSIMQHIECTAAI